MVTELPAGGGDKGARGGISVGVNRGVPVPAVGVVGGWMPTVAVALATITFVGGGVL